MKKIKNTYKLVLGAGLTGTVMILVGAAIFKERNNKVMSKEKKLQIPEFMKRDNVKTDIDIQGNMSGDVIAEKVKERIVDHYCYMDQCAKEIIEEETRGDYTYGQVAVDDNMIEQSDKITEIHKEKFDYIKSLSVAEQMIVLENIPVELCFARIRSELDDLKEFKSTVVNAIGVMK